MHVASASLRLAFVALAIGGLCGWKHTLDEPTRRTRENLEKQYQVVESYRLTYGRLPTPKEFFAYHATLVPDKAARLRRTIDGWGQCMRVWLRGGTLVLLSLGPNGVQDDGGVDDLWIEIEP